MDTGPNINASPNSLIATAGVVPLSSVAGSDPIGPGGWSPRPLVNGEAAPMVKGDRCYLSAADTARLAQSDGTEAQATCVCICIETIAPGETGKFVFGGAIDGMGVGQTPAGPDFLSATAGDGSTTPNLNGGQFNVYLGFWINATDYQFDPALPILN